MECIISVYSLICAVWVFLSSLLVFSFFFLGLLWRHVCIRSGGKREREKRRRKRRESEKGEGEAARDKEKVGKEKEEEKREGG